jgi:phosphopentomutase
MGLGNITTTANIPTYPTPIAAYRSMQEASAGKDTITGHWEIAGILLDKPFPVFPHGLPGRTYL